MGLGDGELWELCEMSSYGSLIESLTESLMEGRRKGNSWGTER